MVVFTPRGSSKRGILLSLLQCKQELTCPYFWEEGEGFHEPEPDTLELLLQAPRAELDPPELSFRNLNQAKVASAKRALDAV